MPSADKEALTIEPWAAAIGLATLALVLGVALFTAWDRSQTAAFEDVITPTAVGDTHFVQEPSGSAGPLGLKFQGQRLDMVSESKIRDSKLIKAGTDDSAVYTIYRLEEEGKNGRLFMKVGVNEFIEVKTE